RPLSQSGACSAVASEGSAAANIAETASAASDGMVDLRIFGGVVSSVYACAALTDECFDSDPDERLHLRELARPHPGDVLQIVRRLKGPVGCPILDDAARQPRTDARDLLKLFLRCGVNIERLS